MGIETQQQLEAAGKVLMDSTSSIGKSRKDIALIILVLCIVIGGMELIVRGLHIPTWILPPPSIIIKETVSNFGYILPHFGITLFEIVCGYIVGAIVGICLAVLITMFPTLEKIVTPYILLLVVTPMIALVPLLMIWLGFSPVTKIIAVIMGSFPVIQMNAASGFKRTDPRRVALGKSLCATEWQIFWKIRFPSALPTIFTGLTIGGIFAIITAIGAEFAGGGAGLGNRILYYSSLLETSLVYGVIVLVALLGLSVYLIILGIGKRYTKWEG